MQTLKTEMNHSNLIDAQKIRVVHPNTNGVIQSAQQMTRKKRIQQNPVGGYLSEAPDTQNVFMDKKQAGNRSTSNNLGLVIHHQRDKGRGGSLVGNPSFMAYQPYNH